MDPLCATRAVKVLKYLHRTVPKTVARSSLDALEKQPASLLAGLHTESDWNNVTEDPQLKSWLANNPIPSAKAEVSGPLFRGTLVFAQVSFAAPGLAPSGISAADTETAINYATLAVVAIQRYASQYGPNSVSVWPVAIPYTARVQGGAFSLAEFEGWVDDVAQFMRSQQVPDPCIVIMHNRSLPNSPSFTGQRNSFHSNTGNGTPYCYSLVFGENLSIADNNHRVNNQAHEKVYAHTLSHEIAETFNDPFVVSDGVHNLTPWWLSPNGNCQDDLETGDVIEGLPNSTFPVTLNGFTYHPQNEALLQWFQFQTPSDALGGAYSYPNTSLLTHVSALQKAQCAP